MPGRASARNAVAWISRDAAKRPPPFLLLLLLLSCPSPTRPAVTSLLASLGARKEEKKGCSAKCPPFSLTEARQTCALVATHSQLSLMPNHYPFNYRINEGCHCHSPSVLTHTRARTGDAKSNWSKNENSSLMALRQPLPVHKKFLLFGKTLLSACEWSQATLEKRKSCKLARPCSN